MDDQVVMNTGAVPTPASGMWEDRDYVRLDNTNLSAPDAAERIVQAFGLLEL